jgi:hypothetical protein
MGWLPASEASPPGFVEGHSHLSEDLTWQAPIWASSIAATQMAAFGWG